MLRFAMVVLEPVACAPLQYLATHTNSSSLVLVVEAHSGSVRPGQLMSMERTADRKAVLSEPTVALFELQMIRVIPANVSTPTNRNMTVSGIFFGTNGMPVTTWGTVPCFSRVKYIFSVEDDLNLPRC